jgi:uncharacterized membrane protein YcaP (DUF421 family)
MTKVFEMISASTMFDVILASFLTAIGCFFIVRIGGKKSVSQLTMPQFVMMITVGSLIAQPLMQADTIIGTYFAVLVFVLVQIILEWFALKFTITEPIIDSQPVVLIKDGKLQVEALRKERMTVDQLEGMLRVQGISNKDDLRTCTLEDSGKLGFEKKKGKDSLTYDDFVKLMNLNIKGEAQKNQDKQSLKSKQNLFDEVRDNTDVKNHGTELD